ncbi:hypothetical protein [Nocardioides sp.]|uniref:hypothetical protein n=1 Tax=Nocardioides sp. TaxID=35761 RepID=UPI00260F6984|nr:hypothetical protein [Nocardioides sp.]MDI6912207.1 hypothetical protein [Nocardioides sp.]
MMDENGVDWLWCPQCFYCAPTEAFTEYVESDRFDTDCATVADDPDAFSPAVRDEAADLRASGFPGLIRHWPDARLAGWLELLTDEIEFRRLADEAST